jgi:DHA3 family macrolide efflux protein-like MFS transporter
VARLSGTKAFALLWCGQAISLIGSGLTGFALGVHVYRETGSVTSFTLIQFTSIAPIAMLSPIAGALTDRWNKARTLAWSDALSSLGPIVLWWCLRNGEAPLWQLALATGAMSTLNAFQWPAFSTLTALLVPPVQLGRAAGAVELARGMAQLFSPLLAGLLMVKTPIGTLLALDSVSFLVSALLMFGIARARHEGAAPEPGSSATTLLRDVARGWRYLTSNPDLLFLTAFFAFTNLSLGIVEICITPFVLAFGSPAALGVVLWVGGVGMLLGGLLMSVWSGSRQPARLILLVTLIQGSLLVVAGIHPSLASLVALTFVYLFCVPIGMATSNTLWLRTVPMAIQGSVQGVRRAVEGVSMPLAALVAGPLVELVFDPMVAGDGDIAKLAGSVIGNVSGAGLALMYASLGVLTVLVTVAALIWSRGLTALPDAVAVEST